MWGYVAPLRKDRKHPSYMGYYCALCRALRDEYGFIAQQALNYDCAFLAMLLGGVYDEEAATPSWCAVRPLVKRPVAPIGDAARFAAAANVLLASEKCRDEWNDEKSLKGRAGYAMLKGAERKARQNYPEMASVLASGLQTLSAKEKAGCAQMDEAADAFAALLGGVMALAGRAAHEKEPLYGIGYHLGKWIYLMDAWDDMEEDMKSRAYNVLLNQFPAQSAGEVRKEALERVRWNLSASLGEAHCASEWLVLGEKREAVNHVLGGICVGRQNAMLEEKN